ncbi:MAG: hypothetical protein ABS882_09070 [Lysinibacillus sp.]
MLISVMKNNHPVDVLQVAEQFVHYSIYDDDAEDYVEQTSKLMQRFAAQLFQYPMYIYFEGYDWEIDDIRKDSDIEVTYRQSGRKVLTMSNLKMYHAEIPAYKIKVQNDVDLRKAFEKWFHLAMENNFWAITKDDILSYENGYPIVDGDNLIILTAEHDAQGVSLITNDPKWIKQEVLENYIDEEFN